MACDRRRSPSCLASLLAAEDIDPSDGPGAFVAIAAVTAAEFLAGHPWWRGMRRMMFGCSVVGAAAAFLVELGAPVGTGKDSWLWTVCGFGPAAYMVTDRITEPSDALLVYAELAEDWLSEIVRHGRNANAFPFMWGTSDYDVATLRDMILRIRSVVAAVQQGQRDVAGWVDGKTCPQRGENLFLGVDARVGRIESGMLVRDHMESLGIVLALTQCPDKGWLALQRDDRFRSMADGEWYKVICLSGGSIASPGALLQVLGLPSRDDVDQDLRCANEFGKRSLLRALEASGCVIDSDRGKS